MLKKYKTPILEGERILLLPFENKNINDEYISWLNDPEVTLYSENRHSNHNYQSCLEYFKTMNENGHYYWAINLNNKHIGNITAYINTPNCIADIAIIIGDKTIWGQGLGLEAWNLAISWLFSEIGIRKITAGTMSTNISMRKIFEKSGMKEEGIRKGQFLQDKKPVDLVLAALFNKEV